MLETSSASDKSTSVAIVPTGGTAGICCHKHIGTVTKSRSRQRVHYRNDQQILEDYLGDSD